MRSHEARQEGGESVAPLMENESCFFRQIQTSDAMPIAKGLTSNTLKLIAVLAMFLDHAVSGFLSHELPIAMVLHLAGRIAAPIMCYLVAEGYFHTSNIRKYLGRLFLFAVLSHFPYVWYFGFAPWQASSVITSLFLGLLALSAMQNRRLRLWQRLLVVLICCVLARPANWNYVAVLWVVVIGQFHGSPKMQMIGLAAVGLIFHFTTTIQNFGWSHWYQLGVLLAIPLLLCYNGQRGRKSATLKWGFYLFYPLHLLLLWGLRIIILG